MNKFKESSAPTSVFDGIRTLTRPLYDLTATVSDQLGLAGRGRAKLFALLPLLGGAGCYITDQGLCINSLEACKEFADGESSGTGETDEADGSDDGTPGAEFDICNYLDLTSEECQTKPWNSAVAQGYGPVCNSAPSLTDEQITYINGAWHRTNYDDAVHALADTAGVVDVICVNPSISTTGVGSYIYALGDCPGPNWGAIYSKLGHEDNPLEPDSQFNVYDDNGNTILAAIWSLAPEDAGQSTVCYTVSYTTDCDILVDSHNLFPPPAPEDEIFAFPYATFPTPHSVGSLDMDWWTACMYGGSIIYNAPPIQGISPSDELPLSE